MNERPAGACWGKWEQLAWRVGFRMDSRVQALTIHSLAGRLVAVISQHPMIAQSHDPENRRSSTQVSFTCTSIRPIRLLKGSIKIQKLAELAKADHQPALALTDTDNMFGALEFSDKVAG